MENCREQAGSPTQADTTRAVCSVEGIVLTSNVVNVMDEPAVLDVLCCLQLLSTIAGGQEWRGETAISGTKRALSVVGR